MFVGISVIEIYTALQPKEVEDEGHGKSVKVEITNIKLVIFLIFIQISLAFKMFSTLMLVEVKLSGI